MTPEEFQQLLAEGFDPYELLMLSQQGGQGLDPIGFVPGDLDRYGNPEPTDSYTVGRQGNILNRFADLAADPYLQLLAGQLTGLPTYNPDMFVEQPAVQPQFVSAPTRFDAMVNSADPQLQEVGALARSGATQFEVNQLIDTLGLDPLASDALKEEVSTGFEQLDQQGVAQAEFQGRLQNGGYGGGFGGVDGDGLAMNPEAQDLLDRTGTINPLEQYTADTVPLDDATARYIESFYNQGNPQAANGQLRRAENALANYNRRLDSDAQAVLAETPTTPRTGPGREAAPLAQPLDWSTGWGAPAAPSGGPPALTDVPRGWDDQFEIPPEVQMIAQPLDWSEGWDQSAPAARRPAGQQIPSSAPGVVGPSTLPTAPSPGSTWGRGAVRVAPEGSMAGAPQGVFADVADIVGGWQGTPSDDEVLAEFFGRNTTNPAQLPDYIQAEGAGRPVQDDRGGGWSASADLGGSRRDPLAAGVARYRAETYPMRDARAEVQTRRERRRGDNEGYRPRGASERDRQRTLEGGVRRARVQQRQQTTGRQQVAQGMDQITRDWEAWKARSSGRTPGRDQALARFAALQALGYGR